jgi:exodeoxyribonuclease-3
VQVATWNVNSIRKRMPRLLPWLEATQPDVVCLQETKVLDAEFPSLELRALGYESAAFGERSYNGVAILSRIGLGDVVSGMRDGGDDAQARFVAATVADIRIVSVYVPNGQSVGSEKFAYKLEWLARLRRWLEKNSDPVGALVVCGDFNVAPEAIDVHDPASWEGHVLFHPAERAALQEVCAWGLVDLYRRHHPEPGRYTWWDYRQLGFPKNRGLRIDHVLGTAAVAGRCTSAEIVRDMRKGKEPSDHAPVWIALSPAESHGGARRSP